MLVWPKSTAISIDIHDDASYRHTRPYGNSIDNTTRLSVQVLHKAIYLNKQLTETSKECVKLYLIRVISLAICCLHNPLWARSSYCSVIHWWDITKKCLFVSAEEDFNYNGYDWSVHTSPIPSVKTMYVAAISMATKCFPI